MLNYDDILNDLNNELGDYNDIKAGKERIEINALMRAYPTEKDGVKAGKITLTGMAYVEKGMNDKPYCMFTFAEDTEKFSWGSGDFITTYAKLLNMLGNGNITTFNNRLKEAQLEIVFWWKKTKSGGKYMKVKALGFVNRPQFDEAEHIDEDTGEVTAVTPF